MATTSLYAEKYAFVERGNVHNSHTESLQAITFGADPLMLLRFPAFPEELKYRSIHSVALYFGLTGVGSGGVRAERFLAADFDAAAVTYETVPSSADAIEYAYPLVAGGITGQTYDTTLSKTLEESSSGTPSRLLKNRTCILANLYRYNTSSFSSTLSLYTPIYTGATARKPRLDVVYSDENAGAGNFSPQQFAYVNPHVENVFRWDYQLATDTIAEITVTRETFCWKETGASSYNRISVTPGAKAVTIPAETFPAASSIEYYIEIVCNSGKVTESALCTSSTADSLAVATPVSPVNTVEDGSMPIVFKWTVENDSGSTPTKSTLSWSSDGGTTWSALPGTWGDLTERTVPANTFPAGNIRWAVRSYNADDVGGPWAFANFVCFSASPAPSVQTDSVPFATISWQSTGQEAYQIELDGVLLGTFFGYDRQYKLQTPLEDGSHVVRVRVQNAYGLWSQYGEASFTVQNVPGEAFALDGAFSVDAALSWISTDTAADFLIFRDGALIGHTDGDRFTDRVALGSHSYYVINRLPSGNYSRSNTVEGRMCTRRPMIALLSGGEWLPLRYSERSMTQQSFTWQKTHSLRHIAGAKFPVLELSPYEDLSGAYDAAFLCAQDAERFYRLRGQVVILKSKGGKVLIGAITSISEVVNTFYQACQFTLEQIQWEDYVDDADG